MAKSRLVSARSELRKGFAVPSKSRILSALRKRSKAFVMRMFWFLFTKATKTDKIKVLMRIEGLRGTKRKGKRRSKGRKRRRSAKGRRRSRGRRKARRSSRRKSRKGRTAKQRAATRKLIAFNKRRRR